MSTGGVGGVVLDGDPGAQWGFAIAHAAILPFWYVRLRHELHREQPADAPAADGCRPTATE